MTQLDRSPAAETVPHAAESPPRAAASLLRPDRRALRGRPPVLVAMAWLWLALIVLSAVFASLLPLDDYASSVGPVRQSPGVESIQFLGTDTIGRSQLSRLVFGAQQSLLVGVCAVLIGLVLGGLLGVLGGFFRGRVDAVIGVLTDSVLAIPPMLLLIAVTAFLERSMLTVILGLGCLTVPTFIRVARANTLSLSQREYVDAARALGANRTRIIVRELIPNVAVPLMSYAFLITGVVIVAEGTLSFLGLGIPPPDPSWGGMIRDGRDYLATDPYLIMTPALVLSLTVLALNVVGDHARMRYEGGRRQ
ncbi:ABC transporter permease [Nocardioides sp. cx-169]|uniref:ABC transporter permease n=1 Tax=Nocardioides sp. cx-169 TaxID=2899080 RepID=UPI001E61A243|nr:ABC transporter permease [Nocardioides sp. cx-169]MCD4533077.1 ABC transporter permease [Nocardioides sp. cx-169]